MSDYVLIPVSPTEAARVQFPLELPRKDRDAWIKALPKATLTAAERVPLPGAAVAPAAPILPDLPPEG